MADVVAVQGRPSLPVTGSSSRYPLRRVFCVGRNYGDHAREMGADPDLEPPFFFTKPADAVFADTEGAPTADGTVGGPHQVPYPSLTSDLQHEIELVVAIERGASDIRPVTALDHVWGYGVGVDLTRRDLQAEAKALRRPWDMSKGFDASGPCSALTSAATIGHPGHGRIWLTVDGEIRQDGDLADQLWPVANVISELSRSIALRPGDLIFTGTPAGVGSVERGSHVVGGVDGVGHVEFTVI